MEGGKRVLQPHPLDLNALKFFCGPSETIANW